MAEPIFRFGGRRRQAAHLMQVGGIDFDPRTTLIRIKNRIGDARTIGSPVSPGYIFSNGLRLTRVEFPRCQGANLNEWPRRLQMRKNRQHGSGSNRKKLTVPDLQGKRFRPLYTAFEQFQRLPAPPCSINHIAAVWPEAGGAYAPMAKGQPLHFHF